MTTNREIFTDDFFGRMTAHLESRGIELEKLTAPPVDAEPVILYSDEFFEKMASHLESRGVDLARLTTLTTEETP